jgi:hypothetical protein
MVPGRLRCSSSASMEPSVGSKKAGITAAPLIACAAASLRAVLGVCEKSFCIRGDI